MLAAHTASFLNLINTALEDISRGVASPHHLHNVRCGNREYFVSPQIQQRGC